MTLILPQEVETQITPKDIKHYIEKGYQIPQKIGKNGKLVYDRNAIIKVHVLDLSLHSYKMVWVYCDMCGNHYKLSYSRALQCSHNGKHYCKHCHCKQFFSGDKNHNWNPNRTRYERIEARASQEYRDFVKKVLKRDNYMCRCCNSKGTGRNLNVHHMNAWATFIDERYDVENGITLCDNCHNAFHSIYGKGNNTKQQFEMWLNKSIDNLKYNGEVPTTRKIYCIEEAKIYNSAFEFYKTHGSTKSNIYQCCRNFLNYTNLWTIKGFHLFWLDEYLNASKDELDNYFKKEKSQNRNLSFINIYNGEKYTGVYDMKCKLNMTDHQWRYRKNDYPFIMYYNDYLILTEKQKKELLINNHESFNEGSFLMQQYNLIA